ncbi:MAG: ABC transporter permease [Lachnospiraceae bacterium]|nr:ABC transporter permease [Lachnospiraceae bacterium]
MKKKKKNWNLYIGLGITIAVIAIAIIGRFWTPYSTTAVSATLRNSGPTLAHPFGCDNLGRDILSRVMSGMGTTVFVAFFTVLIGVVFGTIIGSLTGYFGGWVDTVIMRINDTILSFPSVLLALVFIAVLGTGQSNVILALGVLFIPSFARIVRGEMMKIKELEYVKSARVMGVGKFRIIFVHIIPNMLASMITTATIGFNNAVLAEASMSYLGLGVQPPQASLGRMLYDAQGLLARIPWAAIFPGIMIIIIILGLSMLGEGLRVKTGG